MVPALSIGQECNTRSFVASESRLSRPVQRRGVLVVHAKAENKKQQKKRVKTSAVSADASQNGVSLLEKTEVKAPSSSINVISPVSR